MIYTINNLLQSIDFEADEYARRTLQNAVNLLRLQKGEIFYDRMRGVDPSLYGLTLAKAQEIITQEVSRVLLWEPDIRLRAARILPASDGKDGAFFIEADVEVL